MCCPCLAVPASRVAERLRAVSFSEHILKQRVAWVGCIIDCIRILQLRPVFFGEEGGIENMDRLICVCKVEFITKNIPTKKSAFAETTEYPHGNNKPRLLRESQLGSGHRRQGES